MPVVREVLNEVQFRGCGHPDGDEDIIETALCVCGHSGHHHAADEYGQPFAGACTATAPDWSSGMCGCLRMRLAR